ncbi:MAG: M14 family zinc carboxypeptidase, partial [archaeon]
MEIDFGRYPLYEELVEIMQQIQGEYPWLTKLYSIGKTLQGRDLWTMELTNQETGEGDEKPGL